tara:strand:- start:1518 stop:1742 length:225 start_codon:yes stop_codon:yes gene_type:complete
MTLNKVKDQSDLARDPKTGSLINVNNLDYEKYIASRTIKNAKTKQVLTIEDDLANLKNEMNEIKSLLKELVNGN